MKFLSMGHQCTGYLSHTKMIQLLKHSCTWPSMFVDAKSHCKPCRKCQEYTKTGASRAPTAEAPIMTEPINNLAFDIVGPFDRSGAGFKYLLTCICLASRFPEAIPLKTMTATEVADGILEVFSRHGVPSTLLSNEGTPFGS